MDDSDDSGDGLDVDAPESAWLYARRRAPILRAGGAAVVTPAQGTVGARSLQRAELRDYLRERGIVDDREIARVLSAADCVNDLELADYDELADCFGVAIASRLNPYSPVVAL